MVQASSRRPAQAGAAARRTIALGARRRMLWEGQGIGAIAAARMDLRPFTDKEMRASQDFRRPGGDRHPERAPVQRDQGGAGAADGDRRGAARDQRVADRRAAGAGCRRGARGAALPRGRQPGLAHRRRPVARHDELRTGVRDPIAASRCCRCAGRRSQAGRYWSGGSSITKTRSRSSTPSTRTSARSSGGTDSTRCSTCRCCARAKRSA